MKAKECTKVYNSSVPLCHQLNTASTVLVGCATYLLLRQRAPRGFQGSTWARLTGDQVCRSQKHPRTPLPEDFLLRVNGTTNTNGYKNGNVGRMTAKTVISVLPLGKRKISVCSFKDTCNSVFVTSLPSPTKSLPIFLKQTWWKLVTPAAILK